VLADNDDALEIPESERTEDPVTNKEPDKVDPPKEDKPEEPPPPEPPPESNNRRPAFNEI
jgi:hypothetical protein